MSSEILYEDAEKIRLRITPKVSERLRAFNVFIGPKEMAPVDQHAVIEVPKRALIEEYAAFPASRSLHTIGAFSYSQSTESLFSLGRYCSIAFEVTVLGEKHPIQWVTSSSLHYHYGEHLSKPAFWFAQKDLLKGEHAPRFHDDRYKPPPIIEHDVWIGQNVLLSRGIRIGTGAVVAAGAVVTKDVEPYTIVGGNPAAPIRLRFPLELAGRLLRSQWWNYHPRVLYDLDGTNPEKFIDEFERRQGDWEPLVLRKLTWKDLVD